MSYWQADVKKPSNFTFRQDSEVIDSFTGSYRWLSNFEPSVVTLDGQKYPTVEHAYQAAKTFDTEKRLVIANLPFPGDAKKAGNKLDIRSDWENVKLEIMEMLVREKFHFEPLRSKLLSTGTAQLIEGNWWQDVFWGVCKGQGKNHLGLILMRVRSSLTT